MGKQLVATHKQVDPSMVTAEDLVRAIKEGKWSVYCLALSSGCKTIPTTEQPFNIHPENVGNLWYHRSLDYLANLITHPEPTDNRIVWRPPAQWQEVWVSKQMLEPLPFTEPINGVSQERES